MAAIFLFAVDNSDTILIVVKYSFTGAYLIDICKKKKKKKKEKKKRSNN